MNKNKIVIGAVVLATCISYYSIYDAVTTASNCTDKFILIDLKSLAREQLKNSGIKLHSIKIKNVEEIYFNDTFRECKATISFIDRYNEEKEIDKNFTISMDEDGNETLEIL